jgi:uncharacterized protein (TIGR03663 family)
MSRWLGLGLLLVVTATALALRLPSLDRRPLHNDEAVNAVKFSALWETGRYTYDPEEYHGPALHYATLPFVALSGARTTADLADARLRLAPVFFGAALVLLLAIFADNLGWRATLFAGVLTAISPAMVFYSRYFIHETLLVFFTTLAIGAGWRWWTTRKLGWAMLAGTGLGLMYATKETFLIPLAAMAAATALTACQRRPEEAEKSWLAILQQRLRESLATTNWKPLLVALALALAVSLVLFTSFFTNWHGPVDSIKSYLPWLNRAGGQSPHLHPWSFYLERLLWFHQPRGPVCSEGLIMALALAGAARGFIGGALPGINRSLVRWLAWYALTLTVAYSLIPYKTPWCLLGFWQPTILLAGVGVVALLAAGRGRLAKLTVAVLLVAMAGQLTWQAYRASFLNAADWRNPYTYSQTRPNVRELVERVLGLARVHPDGQAMLVKVIAPESYWPLPWYLRQLKRVGWWDALPDDPYAPVVIASARLGAALDDKSGKQWIAAGAYELRPGVYLELFVEFELWKKFVATLPREPED